MARIEKYHTGIKKVIQHNIREFKDGKCPTNLEVNPEKIKYNYSLIRRGNTAKEIYEEIINKKLVTRMEHAAYLGSELQKAQIAMITGKEYVQDFDLFKNPDEFKI